MARPAEHLLRGVGLRLGGVVTFSCMAAAVKLASDRGVKPVELLFYRNLFSLPLISAWIIAGPGIKTIRTTRPLAHLTRSLIGMTSMMLVFVTLKLLPLAEATTISFSAPLFATILSALVLSEHVGWHRWAAVALGFAGVLVVMHPGAMQGSILGVEVAIVSAFFIASVSVTLRQLGTTEHIAATVFWFNVTTLAVLSLPMPFVAHAHGAAVWMLLLAVGITGGAAQIFTTASVRYASLAVLGPFDYLQLIFAVLFGYFLWGSIPGYDTMAGAALIIGSGLYTIYREHLRHRAIATVEQPIS